MIVCYAAGNEADVELYVNATGLIWENAEDFGALVIFAEVSAAAAPWCRATSKRYESSTAAHSASAPPAPTYRQRPCVVEHTVLVH